MEITERIQTFGRAQLVKAAREEEQAEAARSEAAGLGRYYDASAQSLKAAERSRLEQIASDCDRRARIYKRRAEFAQRGVLLISPDESGGPGNIADEVDSDLVAAASFAGVLRATRETVAELAGPV